MIKDKLENAEQYYSISENLKKGFEWLKNTDLRTIGDGKYVINNNVYANVQIYSTKDDAPFEAHKKFIDIQYMINGMEKIGSTHYSNCKVIEKYNSETDLEFLEAMSNKDYNTLRENEFMVFFPNDAHQPALKINTNNVVKKVIVKVAV